MFLLSLFLQKLPQSLLPLSDVPNFIFVFRSLQESQRQFYDDRSGISGFIKVVLYKRSRAGKGIGKSEQMVYAGNGSWSEGVWFEPIDYLTHHSKLQKEDLQ